MMLGGESQPAYVRSGQDSTSNWTDRQDRHLLVRLKTCIKDRLDKMSHFMIRSEKLYQMSCGWTNYLM